MITQLSPPIELETPKGLGLCYFLIDYGMDSDLYWVVFIHDTGECWTFPNPQIRATKNISLGRLTKTQDKHIFGASNDKHS